MIAFLLVSLTDDVLSVCDCTRPCRYSVGQSLVDPRRANSSRARVARLPARQDFVLAQGLFAAYDANNGPL